MSLGRYVQRLDARNDVGCHNPGTTLVFFSKVRHAEDDCTVRMRTNDVGESHLSSSPNDRPAVRVVASRSETGWAGAI